MLWNDLGVGVQITGFAGPAQRLTVKTLEGRERLGRWPRITLTSVIAGICAGLALGFNTTPASVEEVTRESDLIVLGRVVSTDKEAITVEIGKGGKAVFTRHILAVEAYYKGSGPEQIPLLTHGGYRTRVINGEERRTVSQVVGAPGVSVDEEMLAFLRAAPQGWVLVEWDGAKYSIKTDAETGERTVKLRLRKKKYMQGTALTAFEKLERNQEGRNPTAQAEAKLRGFNYLTEVVLVSQLATRMEQIIKGETSRRR